jgi:hypothetical protein
VTIVGIVVVGLFGPTSDGPESKVTQVAGMTFAAFGVIHGVIGWAQRWQGTRNLGREAWLHVAEIPSTADVPAVVKWPLFLVDGLSVKIGLDPPHIRSRFEKESLQSPYLNVFDAEGRRLKLQWNSSYDSQFDVLVDEQPPDPEALAAALRGALGIDPYVHPLLPLERLVQEMIRVDSPD